MSSVAWKSHIGLTKSGDGVLRIDDKPCSAYQSEMPAFFKVNAPCKIKC